MNRRQFLEASAGVVAAGVVGCSPETPQDPEQQVENKLISTLGALRFLGGDGKEADLKALEEKIAGRNVTVSFGFMGCSDICPKTLFPGLAAMSQKEEGKDLVHIVINVYPEQEALFDPGAFKKYLVDGHRMPTDNVITLFPAVEKEGELKADNRQAIAAQRAFSPFSLLLYNKEDSTRHTPTVLLFGDGGKTLVDPSLFDGLSNPSSTIRPSGAAVFPSQVEKQVTQK